MLDIGVSADEMDEVTTVADESAVRSVVVVTEGKRMRDEEVAGVDEVGGDERRREDDDDGDDKDWEMYDRRSAKTGGARGRRGAASGRGSSGARRWSVGAMDVEGERYGEEGVADVAGSSGRGRKAPRW